MISHREFVLRRLYQLGSKDPSPYLNGWNKPIPRSRVSWCLANSNSTTVAKSHGSCACHTFLDSSILSPCHFGQRCKRLGAGLRRLCLLRSCHCHTIRTSHLPQGSCDIGMAARTLQSLQPSFYQDLHSASFGQTPHCLSTMTRC